MTSYVTGNSKEIAGLLAAFGIECKGVTAFRLNVEPESVVRLELERCVTDDEALEMTQWVLANNIKAEQLNDL
jgi:hypothetical protein